MAGPLPYMKQLPADYARSQIPVTPPTVQVTSPPAGVWAPYEGEPIVPPPTTTPVPPYQEGGVWVGTSPPSSPSYGWLWINSANNCLYSFGDPAPGVWSQIGTNW